MKKQFTSPKVSIQPLKGEQLLQNASTEILKPGSNLNSPGNAKLGGGFMGF